MFTHILYTILLFINLLMGISSFSEEKDWKQNFVGFLLLFGSLMSFFIYIGV